MRYDWEKYESFVLRELERLKVPGAAVCIRDQSGVVYKKGFGFCDAGKQREVTTDTIFGIASMSKSITCVAAAMLEREGRLSFSDPVSKYIPDFKIPGTPKETVLVSHLANHTTGLPPLPTLSWSMNCNTEPEPFAEAEFEKYRKEALAKVDNIQDIIDYIANSGDYRALGQPGEYMSYSNDGYALLSTVIDVAAGEPLESYLERKLFIPLGMERTTFDTERAKAMGNITSLFTWDKEVLQCSDIWDVAPPYRGCGWIKSTAEDMARYYQAMALRGVLNGVQIISEDCVDAVCGRKFAEIEQGVYCYGLSKRLFEDVAICEHSGGLTGVSSRGAFVKDQGFSVTVLTNLSNIDCGRITNAALSMWLGLPIDADHAWAKPKGDECENPEQYVGVYRSRESMDEIVTVELNELGELLCTKDGKSERLIFCKTTVFVPEGTGKVLSPGLTVRFYVREGKSWAAGVGSRIYQKI